MMKICHIYAVLGLSTLALTGCQNSLDGTPGDVFPPSGQNQQTRPLLDTVVFENRLNEAAIKAALSVPTRESRDAIVFARLAEIDALYGEYENSILAEARKTGFILSFSGLTAGLLGGYTTGTASRVYSLIGGGISAAQTTYSKEILAERTVQAFMSQMRAGRAAVRAEIYNNLNSADQTKYPIEAALGDLRRYWQAGTLAAAIVGLNDQASQAEREKNYVAKQAGDVLFNVRLPENQDIISILTKYISKVENIQPYLDLVVKNKGNINLSIQDLGSRALAAVVEPENAAVNEAIVNTLKLK